MTFSEYIKFLEANSIYLLEYQKILLEKMIEEKHDFSVLTGFPVRHCGFSMVKTLFDIYFGMLMLEKNERGK